MPIRRRGNKLEQWEIAMIKAMHADGRWSNDQDILAYFTRPTRSINHRTISEVRNGRKHLDIERAGPEDLADFISNWPEIDSETGLSVRGDELLIKARECHDSGSSYVQQRWVNFSSRAIHRNGHNFLDLFASRLV